MGETILYRTPGKGDLKLRKGLWLVIDDSAAFVPRWNATWSDRSTYD